MEPSQDPLRELTRRRERIALALTAAMMAIYFGFMLLVAYAKAWLGSPIVPGLSWGMALGVAVILSAWLLTFIYVRWANAKYDPQVERLRKPKGEGE